MEEIVKRKAPEPVAKDEPKEENNEKADEPVDENSEAPSDETAEPEAEPEAEAEEKEYEEVNVPHKFDCEFEEEIHGVRLLSKDAIKAA